MAPRGMVHMYIGNAMADETFEIEKKMRQVYERYFFLTQVCVRHVCSLTFDRAIQYGFEAV
jgi:hypothetical protein